MLEVDLARELEESRIRVELSQTAAACNLPTGQSPNVSIRVTVSRSVEQVEVICAQLELLFVE